MKIDGFVVLLQDLGQGLELRDGKHEIWVVLLEQEHPSSSQDAG